MQNVDTVLSMRCIDQMLWCCGRNKVEVFDKNFQLVRTIRFNFQLMSNFVQDVAERDKETIYILYKKRLLVVEKSGNQE